MTKKVLIGGHRGMGVTDSEIEKENNCHIKSAYSPFFIENTLPSLENALNMAGADKADFIETDAIATEKGEIVLTHSCDTWKHVKKKDHHTKRFINKMSTQEVRSLQTGPNGKGRIPTLLELLSAIKPSSGNGILLNIELKGNQGTEQEKENQLIEPIMEAITEVGFPIERILFSSFSLETIANLSQTKIQLNLGVLFYQPTTDCHYLYETNKIDNRNNEEKYLPFTKRSIDDVYNKLKSFKTITLLPEIKDLTPNLIDYALSQSPKPRIFAHGCPKNNSDSEYSEYRNQVKKGIKLCSQRGIQLGLITDYIKEMKMLIPK